MLKYMNLNMSLSTASLYFTASQFAYCRFLWRIEIEDCINKYSYLSVRSRALILYTPRNLNLSIIAILSVYFIGAFDRSVLNTSFLFFYVYTCTQVPGLCCSQDTPGKEKYSNRRVCKSLSMKREFEYGNILFNVFLLSVISTVNRD